MSQTSQGLLLPARKRRYSAVVVVCAVLWSVMLLTSWLGWWETQELAAYDAYFRLRGPQAPSGAVALVVMDDESIAQIGRTPWPRSVHARLLDQLREAKVVAFDLIFDFPATADEDTQFAAAIARHGNVVLATEFTFEQEGKDVYAVLRQPQPPFLQNAKSAGFINFPTDQDHVVRRVMPLDPNSMQPYPAFSLAAGLAALNLDHDQIALNNRLIATASLAIPLNANFQVLFNFNGPRGSIPTYPYAKVLDGSIEPGVFRDKIVMIGPSAAIERDYFPTPFTRSNMVLGGSPPVPGVELHATALESYLQGTYYTRLSLPLNLVMVILIGLVAAVATARRRPWLGMMTMLVLLAVLVMGSYSLWNYLGYWSNIVVPVVTAVLTYLGVTVTNLIQAEMERRWIQGLMGRYVSPAVVAELLQHPEALKLGGQRRIVTIMFADIRGFTSFSEGKSPEEVVNRLNQYLAAMTEVIFQHGGTLDKYLGDGLMAVFGAPIVMVDHADRALAAARGMIQHVGELNLEWTARGEPPFSIGVGLNTGAVVVGNVGSPERMDYTVIGEEVNMASRLESLNKEYGTNIIFSDRTLAYLDQQSLPAIADLGQVQVRGLVHPVTIYSIKDQNFDGMIPVQEPKIK